MKHIKTRTILRHIKIAVRNEEKVNIASLWTTPFNYGSFIPDEKDDKEVNSIIIRE